MANRCRFAKTLKSTTGPKVRRAMIESLEQRQLLSASLPSPIAIPLVTATPQAGTLADGASTPPSNAFTPAQIRTAYGINNIKLNGITGDGTGQTIAIVSAFDDPAFVDSTDANFSKSDLAIFDKQFGLPDPPSFKKIMQMSGTSKPAANVAWSEEVALDVEWAHAIAPKASIVLVEAQGAGAIQLLNWGVKTAAATTGVSVVTMSFGFGEFNGENTYDSSFVTPASHSGVTFVASTGDGGAPGLYPAFSTNVVAVGGTHLTLSSSNTISSETGYASGGGGISMYEDKPSYQSSVGQSVISRTTPDVSFDGDPNTGVAVYDSYNGGYPGWYKIAGTSFSAPAWAGLIAIANQGRAGAKLAALDGVSQTLPKLYSIPASDYHDITSGNNGFSAGSGYDLVTGRGTPIANLLLPDLAGVPANATTSGTASISGTVFVDTNSNGKLDTGEAGLSGVKLFLDTNKNGTADSGEATYTTSSAGTFTFGSLAAGTFRVREVLPSGYKLTAPSAGYYDVTVTTGAAIKGELFGNAKVTTVTYVGSISGYIYVDANSNKKLDTGEKALSGVTVFIDTNKNGKLDSGELSTTTNASGYYYLGVTKSGVYRIREVLPTGYHLTNPVVGYYDMTVNGGWNIKNQNWGNLK